MYRGQLPEGDGGAVDPAAFERAFREHSPPVYRFIARRLGLGSSAPRTLIDIVLGVADLRDCVAVAMSTERVPRGKPAPDIYLTVTERPGFPASECAAVEDSTNGLRSAAGAGLAVVAVPHPRYPPDPAALARAGLVLASLDDLTVSAVEAAASGAGGRGGQVPGRGIT